LVIDAIPDRVDLTRLVGADRAGEIGLDQRALGLRRSAPSGCAFGGFHLFFGVGESVPMLRAALFTLDLSDAPIGHRHDHVCAIAARPAFVVDICTDFPFGCHSSDPHAR
jgi:hypothetical protein